MLPPAYPNTPTARRPASVEVYRNMWGASTAWCMGQTPAATLASPDLRDLHAFQAGAFRPQEH